MNEREALKLALKALEWNLPVVEDWGGKDNLSLQHKAITAIREALAQPDPAAYWHSEFLKHNTTSEQPAQEDPCPGCRKGRVCRTPKCGRLKLPADHPLRSEQPAQQLEQEPCQCPECQVTLHASDCAVHNEPAYQKGSCDCGAQQWNAGVPSLYPEPEPGVSIKAEYEQPAQPEQEPVAWRNAALRVGEDLCSVGPFGYYDMTAKQWLDWALSVVTVHAPPPHRKPLTDEKIWNLAANCLDSVAGRLQFARAIEAAHGIKE